MKKQTEFLTSIMSILLTFTLVGCNGNKKQSSAGGSSNNDSSGQQSESGDDQYINGYVEGYSDGYTDGTEEGYEGGYEEGKEDGHTEGYDEGYQQGKDDQEQIDHDYRSIHTDAQLQYLNSDNYKVVPEGIDGVTERSKPKPLEFSVQASPLFEFSEVTSSKLRISEDNSFANYVEIDGDDCHFEIDNLKINTKYFYYYFAETTHGTFYSDIKEVFVKNEAPRLLNIDGVTNARDDGGWKIDGENKYTKQGLVYRMSRLHTSSTTYITAKGIQQFQALGIKTEIDLRNGDDSIGDHSSKVPGVAYENQPMNVNKSFFTDSGNRASIKNVLQLMANKGNYPLMFHCSIGTDRTGFISFIINALAGVGEESLYRDYLMSNYANIGDARDHAAITNYLYTLKSDYDGVASLSDGAKNYMLDIGLTESEINNIKGILLGDVAI